MMQEGDLFNIENLKVDAADVKAARPPNQRMRPKAFVRVPGVRAHRLCGAKHLSTYKVAIHLLHLHWKSRGKPIRLANAALRSMSVGRDAKWRALLELETLGLVEVSRRDRKSPEVILKNL